MAATPAASDASTSRRWLVKAGKHFLRWNNHFQTRHSRLATGPIISNDAFDWVPELEDAWPAIRAELDALLERPQDIPAFHQISPDQQRISKGNNWKSFGFFVYGKRVDDNCAQCPRTAAILARLPGMRTAMFSILAPRYHIPPHCGPTRAVIRVHLGLKVPEPRQAIWIRVGDEVLNWQEGKVIMFDDTYEHEVLNGTDETRAVLFLDIERPMDRIGTVVNRTLLRLIQASTYVKQPIKNMIAWNREHPRD
ncbi:MAG: aspartyl/asparaginyl beta-hydroxylase domain-containing protein [Rhodanobacter sp.]